MKALTIAPRTEAVPGRARPESQDLLLGHGYSDKERASPPAAALDARDNRSGLQDHKWGSCLQYKIHSIFIIIFVIQQNSKNFSGTQV